MKTVTAVLFCLAAASAQPVRIFNSVDSSAATSDGIEIRSTTAIIRIVALRDDVLRFRLGPQGTLPEDASWAVLPAARTARIPVTPLNDGAAVGFSTAQLQVRVEKSSLRMTVSGPANRVLRVRIPAQAGGGELRVESK
jgi:alpha-glucosidase